MKYRPVDASADTTPVIHAMQVDDTLMEDGVPRPRGFLNALALNEKLFEHRVPFNQRSLCIAGAILIACGIAMFAAFSVLGAIHLIRSHEHERNRFGLQMVPDLHQISGGVLKYSRRLDLNSTRHAYVNGLNKFLDMYTNEQTTRSSFIADCANGQKAPNRWCRFDITRAFSREGRGCTRYDGFGFDSGSPCLLFAFKDEIQWKPLMPTNATEMPFKCDIKPNRASSKAPSTFYFPPLSRNAKMGGFPTNKLPSVIVKDARGMAITDEDGETLYDMPPLVFVKFSLPDTRMHYTVTCSIRSDVEGLTISNLGDFDGRSSFTFDIDVE